MGWSLKEAPGCLDSSCSGGWGGGTGCFLQIALWRSEADLARYVRSSSFGRVLSAMELSKTHPDVRFNEVRETRGMEYLEELRAAGVD